MLALSQCLPLQNVQNLIHQYIYPFTQLNRTRWNPIYIAQFDITHMVTPWSSYRYLTIPFHEVATHAIYNWMGCFRTNLFWRLWFNGILPPTPPPPPPRLFFLVCWMYMARSHNFTKLWSILIPVSRTTFTWSQFPFWQIRVAVDVTALLPSVRSVKPFLFSFFFFFCKRMSWL